MSKIKSLTLAGLLLATPLTAGSFEKDSDKTLLARMLFGEARNCSFAEKVAIAYTAINRANDNKTWNGRTLRGAILCPWQYSCFNKGDPNLPKLTNPKAYSPKAWEQCLSAADAALSYKYPDMNQGQTHYFNPRHANPNWANSIERLGELAKGKHVFLKEK